MHISCTKEALNHAVQTVQKAVASKNTLPILTGIYLSAKDDILEMQATDYEIGISCTVEATVHQPGNIVLSGRYFQDVVRKLPGGIVDIATNQEDRTIKITSQSSQFKLLSLPAEEFPVLKQFTSDAVLTVKDQLLKELIKKTVFACAVDESRPIFTGALLDVDKQMVKMIATNTHRLSLKQGLLEFSTNNVKIIIPSKILTEIARILSSDTPLDVQISWQKNQVAFAFDNIYIISRLIEGQFPDYNRVIPPNFATIVKINTENFLDAVERVSLVAKDGEYNVIKFLFQKDMIAITSNNPDVGMAYETVAAVTEGNDIEIAFNVKYVTDILKNVGSDEIIISLNTPLSPISIKPVNDENYTYIITPVRTS